MCDNWLIKWKGGQRRPISTYPHFPHPPCHGQVQCHPACLERHEEDAHLGGGGSGDKEGVHLEGRTEGGGGAT